MYDLPNALEALRFCIYSLIGYYTKFLALLRVYFDMSWVSNDYCKGIRLRSFQLMRSGFTEQYDYRETLHYPRRNNYAFGYPPPWKVTFKYEGKIK